MQNDTRNSESASEVLGESDIVKATAHMDGLAIAMTRIEKSQVWEADLTAPGEGVYSLKVLVEDLRGNFATDEIRFVSGYFTVRERAERDQDNSLNAWLEHGLLGTRLGPNKNGKKW